MRELKFKVSGQKLEKDGDFSNIIRGSTGYLSLFFLFDEEWNDLTKVAEFYKKGQTEPTESKLIKDDCCDVPDSVTGEKTWEVKLIGGSKGKRLPTNKVRIRQEG